jgi:cell division protein FtsX
LARLFLIALFVGVIIAIVAILISIWNAALAAGQKALHPEDGPERRDFMTPRSLQKLSFVALIVVLFGVSSGWLGGL